MTDETVKVLEEAFSNGASDLQACFIANISKQTLYNYQEIHPEFVDRKEALKDMIKYQAKSKIRRAIEMGDDVKEALETSKWYLERKDKEFKPKSDVTTDDKPIAILTNALPIHNGNQQNSQADQENQGGARGDISE